MKKTHRNGERDGSLHRLGLGNAGRQVGEERLYRENQRRLVSNRAFLRQNWGPWLPLQLRVRTLMPPLLGSLLFSFSSWRSAPMADMMVCSCLSWSAATPSTRAPSKVIPPLTNLVCATSRSSDGHSPGCECCLTLKPSLELPYDRGFAKTFVARWKSAVDVLGPSGD